MLSILVEASNFLSFIPSLSLSCLVDAVLYRTCTFPGRLSIFSLMSSIISLHAPGWHLYARRSMRVSSCPIWMIVFLLLITVWAKTTYKQMNFILCCAPNKIYYSNVYCTKLTYMKTIFHGKVQSSIHSLFIHNVSFCILFIILHINQYNE